MSMNRSILLGKVEFLVGIFGTKFKPLILKFQVVQKEVSLFNERCKKGRDREGI